MSWFTYDYVCEPSLSCQEESKQKNAVLTVTETAKNMMRISLKIRRENDKAHFAEQ